MDRRFVAAAPVDGLDPATLAGRLRAVVDRDDDGEWTGTQNGYATAYAWPDPPGGTAAIAEVAGTAEAAIHQYYDTTGGDFAAYYRRIDGELRLVETYGSYLKGESLDYVGREYGLHVADPRS